MFDEFQWNGKYCSGCSCLKTLGSTNHPKSQDNNISGSKSKLFNYYGKGQVSFLNWKKNIIFLGNKVSRSKSTKYSEI